MNSSFPNLPRPDQTSQTVVQKPIGSGSFLAIVLTSLFTGSSPLLGFLEVARGELFMNTTASATYDSNIFAQSGGQADIYFSLIPELQFLRQAGRGKIDVRAGVDITRFVEFTAEDFEDLFASLEITYPVSPDSPLTGGLTASFTEQTRVDEYLNTRVSSEQFAVSLNTDYRLSERFGLRNHLGYDQTAVDDFSNVESYTATLGLQWLYSSHLAWFVDYRIRRAESTGDQSQEREQIDNLDHALFVGATGVLSPRLVGNIAVGYQQTDARGAGPDRGLIVASAQIDWDWQERTDVSLTVTRDLDISPADESIETTSALISMRHHLDEKIELHGRVGYRHFEFRGPVSRQDNAFRVGAGVHYVLTRFWYAALNFDLTNNNSSLAEADYTRHTLQLLTRYSF